LEGFKFRVPGFQFRIYLVLVVRGGLARFLSRRRLWGGGGRRLELGDGFRV